MEREHLENKKQILETMVAEVENSMERLAYEVKEISLKVE